MKPRVLIVDDDSSIRILYRSVLERKQYEVFEACDGVEALEAVQQACPDVIIMDAMMPNMDGLECTRRLKSDLQTQDIPIIMVSALTESEEIEAGLEAGADEYVTKPVRFKEFVLRVRSMTRLHRSRESLKQSNAARGEQARAMQLLFDFSRRLASADSLENVFEYTATTASELLCCRRASVAAPGDLGLKPAVVSAVGLGNAPPATVCDALDTETDRRVLASGKPEYSGDHEFAESKPAPSGSAFRACVPILSKNTRGSQKVLAILSLSDRFESRPLQPRDREYLDLICNMAATEIEEQQGKEAYDRALDAIVVGLGSLAEYRDTDTGDHLNRVTSYALVLAEDLRHTDQYAHVIDEAFLDDLRRAIPLHDIGKVGIPDAILLKPGKLTDDEFSTMRTHAKLGANVIQSVIDRAPATPFLEMARDIASAHHEKYNGSGYPCGLKGNDIPLVGRIAAVADVYDALRSVRPYKKALSHEDSTDILREGTGIHFDPDVLEAFWRNEAKFSRLSGSQQSASPVPVTVPVPKEYAGSEC